MSRCDMLLCHIGIDVAQGALLQKCCIVRLMTDVPPGDMITELVVLHSPDLLLIAFTRQQVPEGQRFIAKRAHVIKMDRELIHLIQGFIFLLSVGFWISGRGFS